MGNYPNPFNPVTTISFSLDAETPVTLQVYNLRGELVTTLVNFTLNAMTHRIQWDGTDSRGKAVSSGIYYYHLKAGSYTASRKMILLK
jgi:flagellar hook assembly protein FlgD